MGWDPSQGLGVSGDGRTSHIKVAQKLNLFGIGAGAQQGPDGVSWKQNREYEMLLRSLNLRRLSYVILSGDKNSFLTQLPVIQEKLVDTLRNVSAAVVQSEVYLCVRVLLCRLSPHNLTSFWPVILTELVCILLYYSISR